MGGAYGVQNVIMTLNIQDLSFLTTWTFAWYGSQKANKAIKFLGKAENELRDKFFYLQFGSKYDQNMITYVMHI